MTIAARRCEFDGRAAYYVRSCVVCGRRYCLACAGSVSGCWVQPDICRVCAARADVRTVCDRHSRQITPIIADRTTALKRLDAAKRAVKAKAGGEA